MDNKSEKVLERAKSEVDTTFTQEQVAEMLQLIDTLDFPLNNELKKLKSTTLQKLIVIKSYRGLRRVRGLPVRGQRTHTNAKSAKKTRRF